MCSANVCFAQFLESLSVGALEDRGNARQRNVLGVLSAMAFAAVSAPERMITLFPEAKSFAWCRQKKATKQTCKLFSPFFPRVVRNFPQLLFFQSWWFVSFATGEEMFKRFSLEFEI